MSNHPRANVPGRPKRQKTPHAAATFGVLTELEGSRPPGPGTPRNIVGCSGRGSRPDCGEGRLPRTAKVRLPELATAGTATAGTATAGTATAGTATAGTATAGTATAGTATAGTATAGRAT